MSVRRTLGRCPADNEAQEGCGIPWGVTVQPFAATDELKRPPEQGDRGEALPRCDSCWAYLNSFCEIDKWAWTCALCGQLIAFSEEEAARYWQSSSPRPEVLSSFIDVELDDDNEDNPVDDFQARPVFVAAVDLSASEEFLELVKSSLLAALEALNAGALFGLITFSHKIGLYDVQGPVPVVKYVSIPPDMDGKLPVDLDMVMPLPAFLAPVENNKEHIAAALETLRPTSSWERATAAGQGVEGVSMGGRGFGVAMDALINYLGPEYGVTFAMARVFAFLSGPPDYGAGQLDTRRYGEQYSSKGEDADKALLPPQTSYYKDLAAQAVLAGVCVDLFAVTNEYTNLASLKYLSIESGGGLLLYSSTEEATLPQDLYRMLNRPYAFGCILRVRTSTEFKAATAYGHYFPDPEYDNVQRIICCDQFATYAFDFEFNSSSGFTRNMETPPILQMAFQYSILVPRDGGTNTSQANGNPSNVPVSSGSQAYVVKRRLRLRTLQMDVAANFTELYESADTEVILAVLTHKIVRASLDEGVKEARALLHDWLVILTAQYNDYCKLAQFEQPSTHSRLDVAFSGCPQLQALPRLIFALLRNQLLRSHEEGVHPDHRIYLQCLFSALEPSFLLRAVYPVLSSFETLDRRAYPRHSLSRAALMVNGSPIYVLDAFTTLIVYYSPTADPALPFPPPQN
nr:protein transport protein Sec24B-like isoform X2 [Physcomitrium patens]|eukprot:XP_024383708.1 protein transport protein Sec24B-like isoform X2 [Physcomitrella patens]